MNTQDKIKVMQHYAAGGKIEYKDSSCVYPTVWRLYPLKGEGGSEPLWDWVSYDYRIVIPKKKYRVWLDVNTPYIAEEGRDGCMKGYNFKPTDITFEL